MADAASVARNARSRAQRRADSVSMLVCRGCCCGTDKHDDVDHAAQVDRLRAAVAGRQRAKLYTTNCLGPCERSNVVVVRSGSERIWFGDVLDTAVTAALADWVEAGAPPLLPERLAEHRFVPDEESHEAVDDLEAVEAVEVG
jgi:(2Fe-2S) ferredoxin